MKMLSNGKTSLKGWYKYKNIFHRILGRKTYYFSSEAGNFSYWIDRKGNLHPQKYEEV